MMVEMIGMTATLVGMFGPVAPVAALGVMVLLKLALAAMFLKSM